ncbi:hypothetical protein BDQ94DRAFT_147263 [Aspergillus welwitschiae]|uniref:Uncharacterized protein n=1 Tax=Aspergillus welwitschiae TaxID=1341132 RepID=A0A3F3PWL0_9EURO|nr:hypothetical protein BDQ94DRAFT_147263 [Aspergillus welwitschiae]RDH31354.1 hypothetical protein BDQ94DRAFT_147263 [Aspergillus welwitschiae]
MIVLCAVYLRRQISIGYLYPVLLSPVSPYVRYLPLPHFLLRPLGTKYFSSTRHLRPVGCMFKSTFLLPPYLSAKQNTIGVCRLPTFLTACQLHDVEHNLVGK